MSLRDVEFRVLRETIAWRGTVRMALVPVVCGVWAVAWSSLLLSADAGVAGAIPLVVLVAGFEAIHALHSGVERIGRYLQVNFENGRDGPRWESTAMRLGPGLPGGGVDPLFTVVFLLAAAANLALLATSVVSQLPALLLMALLHVAFAVRVLRARRAASQQRAVDLDSFTAVRDELHGLDTTQGV
jgi:hypothetical protein